MQSARRISCLLALLAASAVLLAAAPAAGLAAQVSGVVTGIDLARNIVTLRASDGTMHELQIRPGTALLRNAQPVQMPRLTLYDAATATYRTTTGVAQRLESTGPRLQPVAGALQVLRIGTGTVTVGGRTLILDAASKISRNGEVASLSALTRADVVVAHVAPNGSRAFDLIASGPAVVLVRGTIRSVSTTRIAIDPINGTAATAVQLDSRTAIELNGRAAGVTALRGGQGVEAHFEPTTGVASAVEADSNPATEDAHVSGTVAAVDLGAGSLKITPTGGGTDVTLLVTPATEISVNGEDAALPAVQLGMSVHAEYDAISMEAKEIDAENGGPSGGEHAHFSGTVAAVDLAAATVTLSASSGPGSLTLKVTATTKLDIDDKPGAIGDIKVGAAAKAEYIATSLEAIELEITNAGGGDPGAETHIGGTVSAVDAANHKVTIDPGGGGTAVTLEVTSSTKIEIAGKPGTFTDLATGQSVEAEYDLASLVASQIEVKNNGGDPGEETHVAGTVSAIDVATHKVTIDPAGGGAAVILEVTTSTKIEIDGKPGTFADLATGQSVEAEYDLASLVASQIEVKSSDDDDSGDETHITGSVAGVDTGASTVTIEPSGGGTNVVLKVTAETKIEIDGEPGKIGDIHSGDPARAEYRSDTLEAAEIEIGTDD